MSRMLPIANPSLSSTCMVIAVLKMAVITTIERLLPALTSTLDKWITAGYK